MFTAARKLLINRARRARIVSIDAVADLDALNIAIDLATPERHISARDELRRVEAGLRLLPARCREVVTQKSVNPVTGTNWQGTGVQPDIVVHPKHALERAVALIAELRKE